MPHESERNYEQNFDAMLVRYFADHLVESDRQAFEAWLNEVPGRQAQAERLGAVWKVSADVPVGSDAELAVALAAVKRRSMTGRTGAWSDQPVLRLQPPRARGVWIARGWRIAAAIVIAMGGGLLWRAGWPERAPAVSPWLTTHTYTTGRGERAVVNLSDGSVVTLHTESVLEVPLSFGAESRDVRLVRGEGFFEVARDAAWPFQVHSRGAVARVLGTKFSVRARAADEAVRVAVAEGRVAVGVGRIGRATPVVTADQVVHLRADGSVVIERGAGVERLLSWTGGRLIFDQAPVPEVLAELSRWFNRDFVLGDSALGTLRLTTAIGGQSLAEAVLVLETAIEAHATVDGRRIVLTRR